MLCSYCQTENEGEKTSCSFCQAPLKVVRPVLSDFLLEDFYERPFSELVLLHTYDLLLLVRETRKKRSEAYDLMRSVQKASKSVQMDSGDISMAEEQYRHYTKRMKVIEGILIDRIGYKPKRVDDKLLENLMTKIST